MKVKFKKVSSVFFQMKTHGPDVYALFNKKFSSFALFQGKHGSDFSPYQVSSKYQPRKEDTELILDLRKWMIDFQLDAGSFWNKLILF